MHQAHAHSVGRGRDVALVSRREMLRGSALGFGTVAAAAILTDIVRRGPVT